MTLFPTTERSRNSPEEAARAAGRYMEQVLHILSL
jgi:hypothetical protein